ncbi:MAG TPA: MFS transporter [Chloroflexota bacterium]|nr:MFS transporter [Chloroflexota bacterium]
MSGRLPRFSRNLWLFLVCCVFVFVGIGVQSLVLNLYLDAIGYREDFMGLFSFANTAGIGFAALLAGRVCNRFGPRLVLLASTFVVALSSAAIGLTADPIALVVIGVVNGAALAHIFVPSATFVMDNAVPAQRTAAYSGYFTAQSIAMVIGSYVGGVLPAWATGSVPASPRGYAITLLLSGILAAAGLVPLVLADDSKAEGSGSFSVSTSGSFHEQRRLARRDLKWLVGCNAVTAVALGTVVPFFNVFFRDTHHATTAEIGNIFALGSIAMVLASLLGPSVGKRLGAIPSIVLMRGLSAPLMLGLAISPLLASSAALYIGRILLTNITWPVDNAFSMELVPPDMRATLAALRSTSWNLAWALASGAGGLLIVQFGYPAVFAIGAAFLIIGSAAYYVGFRSRVAGVPPGPALARPAAAGDP